MFQSTQLPNGLRIITAPTPHVRSVSLIIFIGAGSRCERDQEAGSAHFLEHLLFKGTEGRPTSKDLYAPLEAVGGMLNGGTDKELTIYWAKVARPHFSLALDLLADMLLHSRFDPQEVERERQVIIEEINMSLDNPAQRADLLIDEVLWPGQALGRDVAGDRQTISTITRQDLLDFLHHHYLPSNAVVAVAGNIEHQEVVEAFSRTLSPWQDGKAHPWSPADDRQKGPRLKVEHRKTEQVNLCLGLRGISVLHPDRFALDLLNILLGECMTSRLFLEIREKRGLAYDIHSVVSHFRDTGSLLVYAGVEPKNARQALQAILEELVRLREGVTEEELSRTKEFSKGRLFLRLEDTRAVAGWLGSQELLTGQVLTPEEVIARIDDVTGEDLKRVARYLVTGEKLNLAVVGPVSPESLEDLLKI